MGLSHPTVLLLCNRQGDIQLSVSSLTHFYTLVKLLQDKESQLCCAVLALCRQLLQAAFHAIDIVEKVPRGTAPSLQMEIKVMLSWDELISPVLFGWGFSPKM